MLRAKLILIAIRIIMGAAAIGIGIWYLSSSIGGAAIGYSSLANFLNSIGAGGDIANANGCFLCPYIEKLFGTIGTATETFWTAMVNNIWILMAIGFGIYLFISAGTHLYDASKKNAALDDSEKKLEFASWFEKIWKPGARVLACGALIGALGMGGSVALRGVSEITITPVMMIGTQLSMAATGISDSSKCGSGAENNDVLNPVLKPFMCVIGNLNTVMLAGAAGGFALMNYSWMGMGGGLFTWLAGLSLVIMFLIIGFHLFFQILSVIFKLVFLIIFLPLIIAAAGFEKIWKLADGVVNNAIDMLIKSAIAIVAITLKIIIIYATVSFAADEYFPGPMDGYNSIMPPLMGAGPVNPDTKTLSVISVFTECETIATISGTMDKTAFKNCFTARRAAAARVHPGAFDFMDNGLEFILMMIGIFLLYFYAVSPKIDDLLQLKSRGIDGTGTNESFDYGKWLKEIGQKTWGAPEKITEQIVKATTKKT